MLTEEQERHLRRTLKAAQSVPGPELEARAMAAMAQVRRRTGIRASRWLAAAAFVVVLVASGFWLLPRRHTVALAAVARAMANVQSVHFVGSTQDPVTGEQCSVEGWVKGRKFRMLTGGREDVVDDGNRLVTFSTTDDILIATIRPSEEYIALDEGTTYLDLFRGGLFNQALERGMEVTKWEAAELPDGRQAEKAILVSRSGSARGVLIIDANTDLLLGLEEYDSAGKLTDRLERVEYDVEIPDSVFQIDIPGDALVVDRTAPPSQASAAHWEQVEAAIKKLEAKGAYLIWRFSPGRGPTEASTVSDFHPNLRFRVVDNDGTALLYTGRNTYVVFGRMLAEDVRGQFRRVVTNEDFAAPGPPVVTIEERKEQKRAARARADAREKRYREQHPEREAKAREFRAAGGRPVGKISNGRCSGYHRGLWFEHADTDMIEIYYLPSSNSYYVMGKARVYGHGFDEVVEDGWIRVPGPAPKLPEN
jgi:hypothetical protein